MSFNRTTPREEKEESLRRAKVEKLCRYCKHDVKRFNPKRRTFCSDECVQEFLIRSDSGYARKQVYKRDRGVCCSCGMVCSRWFSEFKSWVKSLPLSYSKPDQRSVIDKAILEYFLLQGRLPVKNWANRSTFWDMDHIDPVIENGGTCGLDGLRTLCIPCHLKVTKELNLRRKRGYFGYVAYHENIPRYVGIGKDKRWQHVNSGSSHNTLLNQLHHSGEVLEISIVEIKTWKEACDWEVKTIRKFGRCDTGEGTLFNHTDGGEGGNITGGRIWVNNPETGESKMVLEIPEGWVVGTGNERLLAMKDCGKGYRWITDGSTDRRIPPGDLVPSGWEIGRTVVSTKGTSWFSNPLTKEQLMLKECPEGWVAGRLNDRGQVWIYKGTSQKKILSGDPIPDGWKEGTPKGGGCFERHWIHNPQTGERALTLESIPEGWERGKGKVTPVRSDFDFNRGLLFFHNPTTGAKTRSKESPGPDWVRGMGKRKKI